MENINIKNFGAGLFSLAFSTALVSGNAWAACATVPNCATLGYVMDSSKCDGPKLFCPSDVSKVYCYENTCGDNFFGISECPKNATCESCLNGTKNYQKNISCDTGYAFDYKTWTCKEDKCPAGYATSASQCGTTGSQGWSLGYSTEITPAGTVCNVCSANTCSGYTITSCNDPSCRSSSCTPGDGSPRYKCNSQQTYYKGQCLYTVVENNVWNWVGPGGACCTYNFNGSLVPCYGSPLKGESAYRYPASDAILSCGKFITDGYTVYYKP